MTQKSDEQRIRLESGKESLCRQSKIKRWKLAIERRCHKRVAEELPVMNELTGHQGQDEYIPDREKAQRQLGDTSAAARCQVSHGSNLARMAAYKTCNSSLRIVLSTRSRRLDYSSQYNQRRLLRQRSSTVGPRDSTCRQGICGNRLAANKAAAKKSKGFLRSKGLPC